MQNRLRLLHLENDAADAELIQGTLASAALRCDMTRVETESDFVSALQQGGFDLILADYTLPSFDGVSALRIAQRQCPGIPFIFVSGTLGEDVSIESL
ncbi:MAG TPA: response regulator, partial [Vicinamibacterales bacterium]|nr:response regulator [Vicinamibacterales bacterium]